MTAYSWHVTKRWNKTFSTKYFLSQKRFTCYHCYRSYFFHILMLSFANIGGLLGPVYYSAFMSDSKDRKKSFFRPIHALYQLYTVKFWLPFMFFIITLSSCLCLSIFIPETIGRDQLLEPGEANRRNSRRFSVVSERIRRSSVITFN